MTKLPEEFATRMRRQLGEEFEAFLACYEEEGFAGLRVNTQKISVETFLKLTPFHLIPVPWTDNGFYYRKEEPVTRHPHYFAGLYYIQEPSAMLPAAVLPVKPGDIVLDLCAAPGGKATELSLRLQGNGLLVANDASPSRAKALVKNLAVWGAGNCCITGEAPQRLLETFGCFFDKILVDAPCSGEGMFRKDTGLIDAWMEKGPDQYAVIQKEILACAVQMLKPGGFLVYSTCTFSEEEDEEVVEEILRRFPEMELCQPEMAEGFVSGRAPCERSIRIWPHRVQGEGHFVTLFHKADDWKKQNDDVARGKDTNIVALEVESAANGMPQTETVFAKRMDIRRSNMPDPVKEFLELLPEKIWKDYVYEQIGEQCLLLPAYRLPRKLRYLRTGIFAGTLKRGRFEPSQPLAMLLDSESFALVLNLRSEDERAIRYLKGETIELTSEEAACFTAGWVLVCTDGYALGWGKYANESIKNKYYPGWRLQG